MAAPTAASASPASETAAPRMLSAPLRAVLSVLIAVHLLGVFIAPLNQRPDRSSSPLTQAITSRLLPYLDTAYLNHGYGFFSPDPGSSVIIRYELELPDGSTTRGVLPDRDEHWPRLRYHRHFMLASQAQMFDDLLPRAYAGHLLRTHGATRARLEFVEHRPSAPQEILDGKPLDSADTYRVIAIAEADDQGNTDARLLMGEEIPTPGAPPTFGPPAAQAAGSAEELGPLRPDLLRPDSQRPDLQPELPRGLLRPEGPLRREGPLRPEGAP